MKLSGTQVSETSLLIVIYVCDQKGGGLINAHYLPHFCCRGTVGIYSRVN